MIIFHIRENSVLESKGNPSAKVFNIHINDTKKFGITDVKVCANNINYSRLVFIERNIWAEGL